MTTHRKLWWLLGTSLFAAFFILGFFGREVYRQAPPIPEQVVTVDGQSVLTRDDILTGQQVWQSTGGQQLGSIWGHGAYQAPDWSADWLHREARTLLDVWAEAEGGASFDALESAAQAVLADRLKRELRANTLDEAGDVHVSSAREEAIAGPRITTTRSTAEIPRWLACVRRTRCRRSWCRIPLAGGR